MSVFDRIIRNFKVNKLDYFLLSLIILLAFALRMINIEKPEGLWFDEVYCWYLASAKMPVEFFSRIYNEDFHAPLYFILLHYWMKLFSQADVHLRMFSVLMGVLAVPIVYLIGKEFDYKNNDNEISLKIGSLSGLVASLFIAVNSLLIYYSQEVKFYSFIFLLSSINLLFLIRFLKEPSKFNSFGIVISTICILYTLTISPIYLVTLALIYAVYLYLKDRQILKQFLKIVLITFICYLPYVPIIFHHQNVLRSSPIDLSAVFAFGFNNIIAFIQYLFSPFISTLNNGVPVFEGLKKYYFLNFQFIILVFIPILIGFIGLFKAISKKTLLNLFLLISFCYTILIAGFAMIGVLGFIPRFLLIALPAIIFASAFGLCALKNKILSRFIIICFVLTNVFYLISAHDSAPKVARDSTYGILNKMLIEDNITNKDLVACIFAPKMIMKYGSYSLLDLNFMHIFAKDKKELSETFLDKSVFARLNQKNAKNVLKDYLFSSEISPAVENYLYLNICKKISQKNKLAIILSDEMYFKPEAMEMIKNNPEIYKRVPLLFLVYTKINNDLISFAQKYFVLDSAKQEDFWIVLIFRPKSILGHDKSF